MLWGGEDRKSKVEEMGMRREETDVSTVHRFLEFDTLQLLHVARVWKRGLPQSKVSPQCSFLMHLGLAQRQSCAMKESIFIQ